MSIAANQPVASLLSFGLHTANDVLLQLAESGRERAILYQAADGGWHSLSAIETYARVRALASYFLRWGVAKGDRIAILGENRWEWAVTDFAALSIGAIDVPVYPTLTADQTAALLTDSGSRIAVVSNRQQYDKVDSIRARTAVERIILMDELPQDDALDAVSFSSLMPAEGAAIERDPEFDRRAELAEPDDLATIIYTSGTTGEPKGVMLTHGNIAANLSQSTIGIHFDKDECSLSFLPLSHITARHIDYVLFLRGVTVAYCGSFDKLPAAMTTLKPTVFVGVPRVYEKIRQEVERRASISPVKKLLLRWAIATGHRYRESVLNNRLPKSTMWRLAAKLVLAKIHAAFGGRTKLFIAGGAPLGVDTAGWFADAGIRVLEGYGLTETSPVIALNKPAAYRFGSVGQPLPNVECRIAEDGELLVRGPSVFPGYWEKPGQTAVAFADDGWFLTGDIARMDEDGFLFITDRKKELLKTSGGKMIAPQPIENRLKANLLVSEAALVGDRRQFASVLISPNFKALEVFAREKGIRAADRRALLTSAPVLAAYQAIVDAVNGDLANYETMKRFRLVAEEWSVEGGELTPSMKLKRRVIAARYAEEIEAFYA